MPEQAPARSSLLFSRDALLRLIIPLVIEQLLLMTVGMADTVMVTTSGEAAVSGVSLVDNINTLIIQVFSALSTGGAVVVSQYLGRQDTDNAKAASKQLLYAMCALSLLLMGAALVLRQHILALIFGRVEADVMERTPWSISCSPPRPIPSWAFTTPGPPCSGPWATARCPCSAPWL